MSNDSTEKAKIFAAIMACVFFAIGANSSGGGIGAITFICGVICVIFAFTHSGK